MLMQIDGIPVPPITYRVLAVRAVGPKTLRVTFDDGLTGEIDLDTYQNWTGVFAPLKADPTLFAQVYVDPEFQCVCWPGEVDIDTEALHARVLWQQRRKA